MGFTIKNMSDFEKFKDFTTSPLCYIYYKDTLLNVYYVGYTIQHGYKYLKNHHKLKKIEDALQTYTIQIYTKYDEDSLIKFFKPKLNKIAGVGICGRKMSKPLISSVGEIMCMPYKYKQPNYNSIYDDIWENLFKTKSKNHIHIGIINYIIEQKIKNMSKVEHNIINNDIFNTVNFHISDRQTSILTLSQILTVLKFCKIKHVWNAYIIIAKAYIKNVSWHLSYLTHQCSCGKLYKNKKLLFKHAENKNHALQNDGVKYVGYQHNIKLIHDEIVIELINRDYLINIDITDKELSYYYRLSLSSLNLSDCKINTMNQYKLNPYECIMDRDRIIDLNIKRG